MRAIIVDDSLHAIEALKAKLSRHCSQIKITATFTNPLEAIKAIPALSPDVLFLDVEMPGADGFELLRQLKNPLPEIIFVTAYNHYAIQAIRSSAFDYLEKPVDSKQLKQTAERLQLKINTKKQQPPNDALQQLIKSVKQLQSQTASLAVSVSEGINIIQLSEIVRLESISNYTRFHLTGGKEMLVSKTMGDYEEFLLKHNFFRIHRSHIINLSYLRHYHRNNEAWVEMKDGTKVEVSDRRKKELSEKLSNL